MGRGTEVNPITNVGSVEPGTNFWQGSLRRSFQIELFRGQVFLFYKEGIVRSGLGRFTFNMINLYSFFGEEGCFGFTKKGRQIGILVQHDNFLCTKKEEG